MRNTVLDSHAVLALLFAEDGKDTIKQLFREASIDQRELYITTVNWAEVGYRVIRENGAAAWDSSRTALLQTPLHIVEASRELAEHAAVYKAGHKMSLADAFAAALTKQKKAVLVTGDPEFKPLEGEIKIQWLK
ncbi:MAG: type II toxin-antitoxin system VapC family toxin [Verrucomicrobiota bacterium]